MKYKRTNWHAFTRCHELYWTKLHW